MIHAGFCPAFLQPCCVFWTFQWIFNSLTSGLVDLFWNAIFYWKISTLLLYNPKAALYMTPHYSLSIYQFYYTLSCIFWCFVTKSILRFHCCQIQVFLHVYQHDCFLLGNNKKIVETFSSAAAAVQYTVLVTRWTGLQTTSGTPVM